MAICALRQQNNKLDNNNYLNIFIQLAIIDLEPHRNYMTAPKPFLGRPSQYDLKAIAKELVEWAQNPNSIKFTMFAAPRHLNLQRFSEWAKKDEDFAEAYTLAKQYLDINRLNIIIQQVLPETWYSKNERIYDPIHEEHYRQDKKFESGLRKEEGEGNKQSTYNITVSRDLSAGIDLSTATISVQDNPSPK